MTHSPGPWTLTEGPFIGKHGREATMLRDANSEPVMWTKANRALMSAAPELLAALKDRAYNCECDASSGCHAAKARALIARIEAP